MIKREVRSAILAPKNNNQQKTVVASIRGIQLSTAMLLLVFISACSPTTSSEAVVKIKQPAQVKTSLNQQKQQNIATIEDSINNSYARLAANYTDICPKLLQQDIDKQTIERSTEVMADDYCDYFLYPRIGEQIAVSVNNSQLEALLIVPTIHNFADGSYQVSSYDKHVIRLSYNGATYKPERLTYDIAIGIIN
jgi:hypothetical protein